MQQYNYCYGAPGWKNIACIAMSNNVRMAICFADQLVCVHVQHIILRILFCSSFSNACTSVQNVGTGHDRDNDCKITSSYMHTWTQAIFMMPLINTGVHSPDSHIPGCKNRTLFRKHYYYCSLQKVTDL